MKNGFRLLAIGLGFLSVAFMFQNCGGDAPSGEAGAQSSSAAGPGSGSPLLAAAPLQGVAGAFSQTNTTAARIAPTYVAFDKKLFVFGGRTPILGDGAIYDSTTQTWTAVDMTGGPQPGYGARAVWTGSKILVWGGVVMGVGSVNIGYEYDPVAKSWTSLPQTNTIPSRANHAMAWVNGKLFVFGGYYETVSGTVTIGLRSDGYIYDRASATWSQISSTLMPPAMTKVNAVNAGGKVLMFGGCTTSAGASPIQNFYEFDMSNGQFGLISASGAPAARCGHSMVWTGSEVVVFGGSTASAVASNDYGVYAPSGGGWRLGTTSLAARSEHAAGWLGSEMMVYGGYQTNSFTALSSGDLLK